MNTGGNRTPATTVGRLKAVGDSVTDGLGKRRNVVSFLLVT